MKSRIGYVSNSSSSSFVVIGKVVGDLFKGDFKFKKGRKYYVIGKSMCDGTDVILLDKELADWFKKHHEKNDRESFGAIDTDVIESEWSSFDVYDNEMPAIPEGCRIWTVEADYHSTEKLSDAEHNYPVKEDE